MAKFNVGDILSGDRVVVDIRRDKYLIGYRNSKTKVIVIKNWLNALFVDSDFKLEIPAIMENE